MRKFFRELLRRGLFKVAAIYIVASWVITQVAIAVGPALMLPEWIGTLVIVLLALGLPVAMILAWANELSPAPGIQKKTEVTPEVATATLPPKQSIAVLPFVNMSDDPAQDFFSDGISEELLNGLAKIASFRVAARTSSFRYKGSTETISEIGAALNVAHVLEGSVRKAADTVRITAQLIKAETGYHLWSESYDRSMEDIFAIQDEISAAIVKAMRLHVLGETPQSEPVALPVTTKINTAAYELFLKGRELVAMRGNANIKEGQVNFEKALEIEPNYVPALAGLAEATLLQIPDPGSYGNLPRNQTLKRARELLENGIRIDPNSVEAHSTLAQYYNIENNTALALLHIDIAIRVNPNFASIYSRQSFARKYIGNPELSAIESLRHSLQLDPASPSSLGNLVYRLGDRLNEEAARAVLEKVQPTDMSKSFYKKLIADIQLHSGRVTRALQTMKEGLSLKLPTSDKADFFENGLEIRGILRQPVQDTRTDQSVFLGSFIGDDDKAQIITRCRALAQNENNNHVGVPMLQILVDGWGGEGDKALPDLERYFDSDGWGPLFTDEVVAFAPSLLAHLRRKKGEEAGAQQVIVKMIQVYEAEDRHPDGPYMANDLLGASIAVLQGNKELAFERLHKQLDRVWYILTIIRADPVFEMIHDDPRYAALNAAVDERLKSEIQEIENLGLLPLESWLDPVNNTHPQPE